MTRVPYDQAAKALLQTALTTLGRAEIQHEVPPGEPAWVDVLFEPSLDAPSGPQHGLLGAMASSTALFEPFSEAPSTSDVCAKRGPSSSTRGSTGPRWPR
jgi:hypothetical protein